MLYKAHKFEVMHFEPGEVFANIGDVGDSNDGWLPEVTVGSGDG